MAMTLRLSDDLENSLRVVARRSGRPQSELIAEAIEDYLQASSPLPRLSYSEYSPVPAHLRVTLAGPSGDELLTDQREDRF